MGHEGRRGGGGQDQGTISLGKNRTAEEPTLSCLRQAGKNQRRKVGHPRIVSRVGLCSTRQVAPTDTAVLRRLDDVQPPNLSKMPFVKRGYVASTLQSCCANDQVVEADHFAGTLQL